MVKGFISNWKLPTPTVNILNLLFQGNLCSGKRIASENATRRFYIGEVPEIESEEGSWWRGGKTTRESLSHSSTGRRDDTVSVQTTVRRHSSVISISKRKWQGLRTGTSADREAARIVSRNEKFPDNYIKTSRVRFRQFKHF